MHRTFIVVTLFSLLTAAPSQAGRSEKVAVLNLKNTEGISQGETELISDRLRNELFSTGKVEVMERDQMQAILAEQGFQQTGATCSDEGCMVEAGKMLGVKLLVSGSIGKLGKLYMVNVKSINVETGRIEAVVSEDVRGEIEDVVEILPVIARKLTGSAPVAKKEIKRQLAKVENSDKQASRDEGAAVGSLPCDGSVYIERINLPKKIIGFSITPDDARDIDETMADAFEEALDKKIETVSSNRLAETSCKALTIRVIPKAYTVEPAIMKQFTGTLRLDVALFTSPRETQPLIIVPFEKKGDRHWGDVQPLKNAFEAVAEAIEDDYRSKVKKTLKKAGY